MKITISGSLGNIGRPLALELIDQGHTVTVISNNNIRKKEIEALGAKAAIGSVKDAAFLTSAFDGSEAAFLMVPPPDFTVEDSRLYYQSVGSSYARAIRRTGINRIVHLSSWGAHLSQGTGNIAGSHDVETILNGLTNVALTHLRPGSFYNNLLSFIVMIKHAGFIGSNYGGNDKIVMAAPWDIADAAAEELTSVGSRKIRYVASEDITANDAARILGEAIGTPGLRWLTITDEQCLSGLLQAGLSKHASEMLVQLGSAIHTGHLREDYDLHKPEKMGVVKLVDFAEEFADVFRNLKVQYKFTW